MSKWLDKLRSLVQKTDDTPEQEEAALEELEIELEDDVLQDRRASNIFTALGCVAIAAHRERIVTTQSGKRYKACIHG